MLRQMQIIAHTFIEKGLEIKALTVADAMLVKMSRYIK